MHKVLLIGSNGLLGRRVKSGLIDSGYSVTSVTRSDGFDVGDRESFKSLSIEYECVINLAAIIQISEDGIEEAVRVNGLGVLNAAIFAKSSGARFINASTISALSCCDDDYCKSYYALSKRIGDDLAARYCEDNTVGYSILRFSQLYDTECEAEKYQPMLYRIIKQIKHDGCVTMYGNNDPARNYLHVDDAAAAILISIKDNRSGIWNCIHPVSVSLLELVNTISDVINIPARVVRLDEEDDLPQLTIPDQYLYHQAYSEWEPRSLADGIRDIVVHVRL